MSVCLTRSPLDVIALIACVTACGRPVADSDFDGLTDAEEKLYGTNPALADTDGDGFGDGYEVYVLLTNPNAVDTDGDGVSDYAEVFRGTNPRLADSDGDGIADNRSSASAWFSDFFTAHGPTLFGTLPGQNVPVASPGGGGSSGGTNNDRDGDGITNANDNCPDNANSSQADIDSDGTGDACDTNSYGPSVALVPTLQADEGAVVALTAAVSDSDATPTSTFTWSFQTADAVNCQFADSSARITTVTCDDDGVVTLERWSRMVNTRRQPQR